MSEKKRRARIVRTARDTIAPSRLRATASVMREQSQNGVPSDVNGSYTGTPIDFSVPEQDSDDL